MTTYMTSVPTYTTTRPYYHETTTTTATTTAIFTWATSTTSVTTALPPPELAYSEYTDSEGIPYVFTGEIIYDTENIGEYIESTYVFGAYGGRSVMTEVSVFYMNGRPEDKYRLLFFYEYADWELYVYKRR